MNGMTADAEWVPPPTGELAAAAGRVLRYCGYGPETGPPVISLSGTPGTRWERPGVVRAIEAAGLRLVVPDRPGYGGSARQPERTVADVAADVRAVADAHGWARFAVTGFSGGGPHALACAALLAGRVTCCAVVACPAPPGTPGADLLADRAPGQAEDFRLALRGEQALRPYLRARADDALARIEATARAEPAGPGRDRAVVPGQPASPAHNQARTQAQFAGHAHGQAITPGQPTGADAGRAVRLRAMYLGLDGWVDDVMALARPWGFDLARIEAPTSIWYGASDTRVPREHTDWLLAQLPTAQGYQHPGGHDPSDTSYQAILGWIAGAAGAAESGRAK
jgi:pimeloyl-ACP methyl ester carboxylesterase